MNVPDPMAASAAGLSAARSPDRYAVVGNPIAHSRSPGIHARFAAQTGQAIVYDRLLAPFEGFAATVRAFAAAGGRGLNVTVPFKVEACALATRLSERARAAGAVNTLGFDADGTWGDNTDGVGLVRDLHRLAVPLAGATVVLLGAGGAARGVALPLLEAGVRRLVVANRTVARAQALVADLRQALPPARAQALSACSLDALALAVDGDDGPAGPERAGVEPAGLEPLVIVNATSAGLEGEAVALPPGLFARTALAYDMVYGAEPTGFMRMAQAQGAVAVADGLGMLVEQAAESFRLWRGVMPDPAPVLAAVRAELLAAAGPAR